MASIKRGALVASALLLIAILISACNQPYSQQPTATAASPGPSLFESPIVQTPGAMGTVESFGTATALALSGTPLVGVPTQTLSLPLDGTSQSLLATLTPTPLGGGPVSTSTSTLAVGQTASTIGPLPTSAPVGVRPATYELKRGEFPYCIARRYDLNPQELLTRNGLTSAEAYNLATGTVLSIPQSGSFPGTRALRNHPATYTVASSTETVYSIACLFGDVDPARILEANNLSGTSLTVGQALNIP
jgi:LysM repeat protein